MTAAVIEQTVWLARDGWRLEVRDGPRWLEYGPYRSETAARVVGARIVAALDREQHHRARLNVEAF